MSMAVFSTRSWCSLLSVFPAGMLPEEEKGGREPCSVLSYSQTLSALVVVCSVADTLVIDQ